MIRDPFNLWRDGQAYRTPRPAPVMAPVCPACFSRHTGATPNCELANEPRAEDDHDDV